MRWINKISVFDQCLVSVHLYWFAGILLVIVAFCLSALQLRNGGPHVKGIWTGQLLSTSNNWTWGSHVLQVNRGQISKMLWARGLKLDMLGPALQEPTFSISDIVETWPLEYPRPTCWGISPWVLQMDKAISPQYLGPGGMRAFAPGSPAYSLPSFEPIGGQKWEKVLDWPDIEICWSLGAKETALQVSTSWPQALSRNWPFYS